MFQITVGVFGHEEEVLDKPVTPSDLKNILFRMCSPYDIRQAVLQQELIIAIGKLIAFSPQLFDGILKIRIGYEYMFFFLFFFFVHTCIIIKVYSFC
jgi:phosphorylase kinase alpha/beta subunit